MFDIESYHKARTVEEAIQLLSQNPKAIPLAGGTDILVRLHQGNPDYRHVVDIHDVDALKEISRAPDGTIEVGSGATLNDAVDNGVMRLAGLVNLSKEEIMNRVTISGAVEIGRLPGVVAVTMLVPLAKLEELGLDWTAEAMGV